MSVKNGQNFQITWRFRNTVAIPTRTVGRVWFAIRKGGLHVVFFWRNPA